MREQQLLFFFVVPTHATVRKRITPSLVAVEVRLRIGVRFNWHFARVKNAPANRRRRVVDARNCRIPNIVGGVFCFVFFMQMRPSRRKGRVRNGNRPNCVKLFSSKLHRPPFFFYFTVDSLISQTAYTFHGHYFVFRVGGESREWQTARAIRQRCWTPERDRRRTFRFVFKGKKRSFFVFFPVPLIDIENGFIPGYPYRRETNVVTGAR